MKKINVLLTLYLLFSAAAVVHADQLVAYWPLNGDPNDASGNNNNGTLIGGSWDAGIKGQALKLTGANQYIEINPPNPDAFATESYSISFWAKIDSWSDSWNTAISFAGEDSGWAFKRNSSSSNWQFVHRGDPETDWGTSGPSIDLGKWTHFAVAWDGTSKVFTWYKNGLPTGTRTLAGHVMSYDTQWPVMIGACSQGGAHQFLPGNSGQAFIDEVRIYDYMLDADDIFGVYATVKPEPMFISQPISNTVYSGGMANFTVSAKSVTEVEYQWYKDGEMLYDVENKISGSQTDSLTINNVTDTDLGDYWCVASNAESFSTSNIASLNLKKLLGHWPLDAITGADPNSVTPDISDGGNDGLLVNGPTLIAGPGSDNNGMEFTSSLKTQIEVANESYFDSLTSLTVSAWVKTTWAGGDWRAVVSKGGEEGVGWQLRRYWNTGQACFTLRGTSGNDELASGVNVNDNKWHLVTGTYDGMTRKIYVDGVLRNSMQDSGQIVDNDYKVFIGAHPWGNYYTGGIDDVRIYNYALTAEEVALLYTDTTGGSVCTERLEYDLNNDCRVNLEDFLMMVSEWLECGLYPPDGCY